MADTLKFGPEWLRALSDGNGAKSTTPSPAAFPAPGFPAPGFPKYKLAENRYGREEMLALFVPHTKVPEPLLEIPSIVVEKAMHPLAFIPPSEDEQRLLSSSVNSPAVLRLTGRGSSLGERGRGERGRGGGERGRGRGRGRGEGFYTRGSYEEDGFGRGRHIRGETWDESERPRFERGSFTTRASFDEGPPSPRREYSRSMSSDNWREAKKEAASSGSGAGTGEDDDGDWRRAGPKDKWGPRSSWREPRDRSYNEEGFVENSNFGRTYRRSKSGSWDDSHDPDGLPEWSTADFDDGDDIGTFDSSGAFMSLKEAEELDKMGIKYERVKSKDQNKEGRDSSSPASEKETEKPKEKKELTPPPPENKKDKHTDGGASPKPESDERESSPRPANTSNGSQTAKEANAKSRQPKAKETVVNNISSVESSKPAEEHNVNSKEKRNKVNGDVQPKQNQPKASSTGQRTKDGSQPPTRLVEEEADFGHLEQAAENMVATWTAEEDAKQDKKDEVESGGVPIDHEDAKKWFYKDPQGDLQGPFTNAEMSEWFSAGYFTMNLLVKRGCDDTFHSLGELIKRWGRVPFLPGPTPPPCKAGSSGPPLPTGSPVPLPILPAGMAPPVSAGTPVSSTAGIPKASSPIDPQQQEQMMKLQQQMMMQQQFLQQQALLRQLQLQQIIQGLQQQEAFQKLSAQQQQQLAMNLLMKQQQHAVLVQQQQQLQQGQQKLSPRSPPLEAPQSSPGGPPPFQRSLSQPADAQQQQVPRSMSQPGGLDDSVVPSLWGASGPPKQVPNSGWGTASVWDVEGNKAQSLEEIQQLEMDRQRREQEEREAEMRRKHEEEMHHREEDRKRKEMEERQRKEAEERHHEMERQDMERQKELDRMRQKELERQREMERRQEMERLRLEQQQAEQLRRQQEEQERRRVDEERRHREEERRRQEEEHRRMEEERRLEEELRRQQEVVLIEQKRQEEIRRRQVLAANEKAETLRRIQEAQLANIQLPASAQWANTNSQQSMAAGLPLAEIQVIEAERERKEQEERKAKMEIQRQQLAAIQQQQQQGRSWAASQSSRPVSNTTKSLLEIQQEQARQEQDTMRKQAVQAAQRKPTSVPLSTAAVWGGNASTWATEGAWGNPQTKANLGFWEDAPVVNTSNKRTSAPNNANFPALNNPGGMSQQAQVTKSRTKAKKEEETVQRLFQAMKPKDEFTQWCENSLKGMQSSVDVPTFIAFLTDIESPFEVHDYVRSYLGESKDANGFAQQFIEKRSKYRNQLKQQEQEESMWGPAPAITPGRPLSRQLAAAHTAEELSKKEKASKKEKKKKMQKLDAGILGFTVQPAPDRLVGEIDSVEG